MALVHPDHWQPQGVTDLETRAWEALRETRISVLVTAGAGAGKTEFLAQKAAYLLQTGLCPAPKRILAISFKRDAARNLSERVARRCTTEQSRRFDSYTFDAFAKGLVDRFRAAIPETYRPTANYRIMFPGARDIREFLEDRGFYDINPKVFEKALANEGLPIPEGSGVQRAVVEWWRTQYEDYDDTQLSFPMVNRLVDLLIRENETIRRALHLTYPVVFLDEFQDTTVAQFGILGAAFNGSEAIFTAVGDDKQKIMGWAGAMPDAFSGFEDRYGARRVSLVYNWRSHEELVRLQHVIGAAIDPNLEQPEARGQRTVNGDVAAIWEFTNEEEESETLAQWITQEALTENVELHDIAILVRFNVNEVEERLRPFFEERGIAVRNVARSVAGIAIQDLISEDLTQIFVRLLRLGIALRDPESWNEALRDQQFLSAIDTGDEIALQKMQSRLATFIRELRRMLRELDPTEDSVNEVANAILGFVGIGALRQAFPSYRRQADFDRVWNGFVGLLSESLVGAASWLEVIRKFEGHGQVVLMTVHKSKGLEFHAMIFCGLDNKTWWNLTPSNPEELNSFFVAFTRAKQRAFFTYCRQRGQAISWIESMLTHAGLNRIRATDICSDG